jgi:uncharacterized membrane protein YphA (DoxX/SURF4 family)
MGKLSKLGRVFFAISMAAFGVQSLIYARFAAGPGSGPPWTPAHPFWAYFTAIVSVAVAASIATNIQSRCAAILLAITILLRVLLVYAPKLAANPHDPGPWTSGFELLAMCGTSLVLAGTHATIKLGRLLFAIPLVVFGVQHFLYAGFVATLVPSWILGHLFWAYFVGVAFVAAAVSIATEMNARLASTLLGIMFLLWVLILHLPRVVAAPHNGNEWTSAFVALAMSGGAFLVAGTLKPKK